MKDIPKIFIVDDDPIFQNLLKNHLVNNMLNNVEVYSSGIDLLNNIYKEPDILILDHKLGDMDGFEILQFNLDYYPNIKTIYVSSSSKVSVAIKSFKLGVKDFVEKNDLVYVKLLKLIKKISKEICSDVLNKNQLSKFQISKACNHKLNFN